MRVILPFVALLAVASSFVAADQPQGIDYLGAGYDLVFGNPDGSEASSSVTDPGFRVHLIKYNWDDADNTCSGLNNGWTCPREVSIMPDTSCMQQSSSSAITSTKEFQEVLQEDCSISASISGSYGGFSAEASFSGSKSMASMQNKILKEQVTTFQSKAVCVEYTASLKQGFAKSVLEPLPEFSSAVGDLPVGYNSCYLPTSVGGPCPQRQASGFGDLPPVKTGSRRLQAATKAPNSCACDASVAKYFRFIQQFGTHYTTRVEMGGKIVHRLEIKNSDVETLKDNKVDVAYGASFKASYSGLLASVSASVDTSKSTSEASKAYENVMKVAQKEININVGGSPSDDWREWAKSTTDTPMPIRYRLSSLVDLIQLVDPAKVAPFESAVKDYIAAYGQSLSFDTSSNSKVKTLRVKYSVDSPFFGWLQLRVMIGNTGAMIPADVTLYDATGTFNIDVPETCRVSFGAFDDRIPVTLQYVTGRFYPPAPKVAMEAQRAQHHAYVQYHDKAHAPRMEAKHAMKAELATAMKGTFGFTMAPALTFVATQAFAVMSDDSVIPLGNQYAGKQLNANEVWSINPMY